MTPPTLYPLFLKLADRPVVVVGGGPIAAQKARELVEAGARVRLVSPARDEAAWAALADRVQWEPRCFEPGDCVGAVLVISATARPDVDAAVVRDGHAHGALVNTVDVPDQCDFYAGAVVRRGPVTVSISSAGASPSVAIAIRRRIEALLPAWLPALTNQLFVRRPELLAAFPAYAHRAQKLNTAVDDAFERVPAQAALGAPHVDAWIDRILACPGPCDARCCATSCLHEAVSAGGSP